ncbi:DUF4136 domain-containing protein [Sulfurimonas sp. CS5]|jgi:hypothetical protein|uniref:DUF4136 domain-containing protein n=1 Tax=Sulfurimonas sp. CS5 TaxID=3391145 RepID=UPI0039EC2496
MRSLLLVIVAILIGGCSSLQVSVDYDSKYNFKALSTFSVVYVRKNDNKDFARSRVSKVLERYIEEKGYKRVDKSKADFYFLVHLDIKKKTQIETNYETIGIQPTRFNNGYLYNPLEPRRNRRDNYYTPDVRVTTQTYEYEDGKLIIEVFDVKQKEVVWQSIAKDELSGRYSQEEKNAYLNKVIKLMFKDFPSK